MSTKISTVTDVKFETTAEYQYNNVANQTSFDLWALEFINCFYLYYTPLLVCLGSIGNLASVFVFYSSKLRLQSTSQYLSALAVSDTIFLLQLLAPWLSAAQISDIFHEEGFCQVFVYISYVTCCLSAWLVVAFTVERFVAVVYPLQRNSMCTLTRSRILIVSLTITSIGINIPVLQFALPYQGSCHIDIQYHDHAARFNMADTAISFTLPLTLIILLNTFIMAGVYRLARTRKQLMKAERLYQRPRCARLLGCPRSQQKVTRMLLIVSSVFVILNFPAYMFRILAYNFDVNSDEIRGRWTALQQLSGMFFYTNFGINFILYCLNGQNFRHALVQAMPCTRRRAQRAVTIRRTAFNPARANSLSRKHREETCTPESSPCSQRCVKSANPHMASVMDYGLIPWHSEEKMCDDAEASFGSCNLTEVTTAAVANVVPNPRRRPEHFITRWTFDNSRQGHNQPGPSTSGTSSNVEVIEMSELTSV